LRPHDGEVAGGAGFLFSGMMELGQSERPTMRPLWSYRVDGADSPKGSLFFRGAKSSLMAKSGLRIAKTPDMEG